MFTAKYTLFLLSSLAIYFFL